MFSKFTILIPVYNEEKTMVHLLDLIQKVELVQNLQKEIIIVNDGSTDGTEKVIQEYQAQHPEMGIQYIPMEKNLGKGAAIQRGLQEATGDILIIQDADLEYDPREYNILIQPILDGFADVVYGSRFMGGRPHRILFFWHSIGNRILTFISNMFSDLNLTDMETGFKVFRTDILRKIPLQERSFGFEPEVTAKIAKIPGIRIYEVGISYYGRTYAEGKKINWKDGVRAIYCILKYNLFSKVEIKE